MNVVNCDTTQLLLMVVWREYQDQREEKTEPNPGQDFILDHSRENIYPLAVESYNTEIQEAD